MALNAIVFEGFMANINDSRFIEEIMTLPDSLKGQFFADNAHRIIDDAAYWNVLGTLWKLGGTVYQQEQWRVLFLCDRKQKHKIMKSRERKKWRRLPTKMMAYRAVNNDSEAAKAISWSLSKSVVERCFTGGNQRQIVAREFLKSEIFAFFDRRGEDEILVNL